VTTSRRLITICLVIGAMMILAGAALPPERILHALMPAKAASYRDKLLAGLWFLKAALIADGLLLTLVGPLKRWLWDAPGLTGQSVRPFYRQANPGPMPATEWVMFTGIVLLALVLRLIGAGQSLFGDEIAVQQMFISRGLPVIVTYFPFTPQHVLYSLLAWFCEKLPLPIELSYRLPSILFSTAAVALTCLIARRLFDRLTAGIVGLLSAAAFYGIIYANNAKGYTATYCFATLAILGVSQIVENWQRPRGWFVLGTALWGLSYVHLYNAYLCIGLTTTCGLAILIANWGQNPALIACVKRFVCMLGIIGAVLFLLYALQLPQILDQARRASGQPEEHLSPRFFRGWLMQLTFWGEFWPVALALLAAAVIGAVSMARREPLFSLVLLLSPLILLTMTATQNTWIYPRYMVFTLVPFIILSVEGVRALGALINQSAARLAVIALAVVQLGCTGVVLREYYAVGNQNIRAACYLAAAQAKPGDKIVSYGLARDLFPFYSSRLTIITSQADLEKLLADTPGDIYLMYGWRYAWHGREDEFAFIDKHFTLVKHYDGFLMDSVQRDGDVVLLVARKDKPPAPMN
jgi:hypothetical protein